MRTSRRTLAALPGLWLAFALLPGCGGTDAPPVVLLSEVAARSLAADCAFYLRCGAFTSTAACTALLGPTITGTTGQLVAAAGTMTVLFDGAKAGRCLAALESQPCDTTQQAAREEPPDCARTFTGAVADGAPCAINGQCASGTCNLSTCPDSCCTGRCHATPPAPAAIGAACSATVPCVAEGYCNALSTCAPLLAEGQACESNRQCAFGTLCAGPSAHACTKVPVAGGPCLRYGALTGLCGTIGLACDSTDHCAKVLGAGGACPAGPSVCAADLACDPVTNKCVTPPAAGQACVLGQCAPEAYCVPDTSGNDGPGLCTARAVNGQPCESGVQCTSGSCQAGLCADPAACIKP